MNLQEKIEYLKGRLREKYRSKWEDLSDTHVPLEAQMAMDLLREVPKQSKDSRKIDQLICVIDNLIACIGDQDD